MRTSAPALLPLFRSDLQAEILARLLLVNDEVGISELARELNAQQSTVHREVSRLVVAGVLANHSIGRTRLVSANRANPAYEALLQLMQVVYGPAVLVRTALADIDGISEAFIYGSWAARATGTPGPPPADIDLIVVGSPDSDTLHHAMSEVETRLHREVNFIVITPTTWAARADDQFLAGVDSGAVVTVRDIA